MPRVKKGRKRMSETAPTETPAPEVIKEKVDLKNDVRLEISAAGDGSSLKIFVRAPVLADVIAKMTPGNWRKADYAEVYKPLLVELEANRERVVTRPAVAKATANFVGGSDFDWDGPPRACLLYNPGLLREGFTLTIKVEKPVPPDTLRRWGKQFMDGCGDIISNARPFRMSWVAQEVPKVTG